MLCAGYFRAFLPTHAMSHLYYEGHCLDLWHSFATLQAPKAVRPTEDTKQIQSQHAELFAALDGDGNGLLSLDELQDYLAAQKVPAAPGRRFGTPWPRWFYSEDYFYDWRPSMDGPGKHLGWCKIWQQRLEMEVELQRFRAEARRKGLRKGASPSHAPVARGGSLGFLVTYTSGIIGETGAIEVHVRFAATRFLEQFFALEQADLVALRCTLPSENLAASFDEPGDLVNRAKRVAPLWEMLDKVLSAGRPQVKYRGGSGLQPLLPIRDVPHPSTLLRLPAAVSSSVPIWSSFPFIAMLGRLAALGCIAVFAHAAVHVPTREIAAGVQMPIISIGIGGLETANASAIVSNWLKLGGRGIDTALVYKDQYIVPQELQKAGIDRKDVFITTKIPGCDFATTNIEYDLKQLKTDYIDLLLIHYPSGDCAKVDCSSPHMWYGPGYVSPRSGCCHCEASCANTSGHCTYYDAVEDPQENWGCYEHAAHQCDCLVSEAGCTAKGAGHTWTSGCTSCASQGSCYDMTSHEISCDVPETSCSSPNMWYAPGYVSPRSGCCHCRASCKEPADNCSYSDAEAQTQRNWGCYDSSTNACDCDTTEAECSGSWTQSCRSCNGEVSTSSAGRPRGFVVALLVLLYSFFAAEANTGTGCYDIETHRCDCTVTETECLAQQGHWTDTCRSCDSTTNEQHPDCQRQYSWGCFDEASHACQCTVSERACDTAAGKFWTHECWSCCHGSAWGCFVPGNGPESGCHCNLYEGACALDFPDATWSHQCFECEEDSVQKDAEAAMDDGGVGVAVAVSVSVTVVVIAACIGIYCLWAKMRKPKPVNEPYNSPQFNQSDVVVGLAVSGSAPSPAWEVLEGYHAKGVLKAIGVSNFNKSALESLMKTAKVKPAVNQIELNVLEYDAEGQNAERQSWLKRQSFTAAPAVGRMIELYFFTDRATTKDAVLLPALCHDAALNQRLTNLSRARSLFGSCASVRNMVSSADRLNLKRDVVQCHKRMLPPWPVLMAEEPASNFLPKLRRQNCPGQKSPRATQMVGTVRTSGHFIDPTLPPEEAAAQLFTAMEISQDLAFVTSPLIPAPVVSCTNSTKSEDPFKTFWDSLDDNMSAELVAAKLLNTAQFIKALAYAESLNITVEAYSPVGRSGHSGDISGNKVIQGVAANHNISTYQVALKWIVQHGRLLTFQSSSSAHQAADAAIFDFQLTEAEMKALDGLHGAPIYV
ncbi:hypothetical protein AK812_SmicGene1942 [Symbiodinium microadriaticum]|uniref:EF-hand domain-containing protein n=1 Tax=Symbiodinium microadriaticum TaxID=2951 RepID=A0A1Q9F2S4_SYMMI|nr:hypothetical protein AK812_SmicGene1942 [Symbiodinium microadriaticum]